MTVDVELAYLRNAMARPVAVKGLALLAMKHPGTPASERMRATKLYAELAEVAGVERCENDERAPADIVTAITRVLDE